MGGVFAPDAAGKKRGEIRGTECKHRQSSLHFSGEKRRAALSSRERRCVQGVRKEEGGPRRDVFSDSAHLSSRNGTGGETRLVGGE